MNLWTGALAACSIALLLVSIILQLHEWGIRPLRDVSNVLNRPWFERLLLLFVVCGMVQYAATKGTNGADNVALSSSGLVMTAPSMSIGPAILLESDGSFSIGKHGYFARRNSWGVIWLNGKIHSIW